LEKDIYKVVPAPDELKRYVRCYMVANADDSGGLEMPVRPTGYCYFGWVLPNSDSCSTKFSAQHLEVKSRTTHLSGQVSDDDITIKYHGAVPGLYELFHVNAEKWTNICVDGGSVSPAMNKVQTDLFKGSESFAEEDLYSHIELFTAALIKQSAQAISAPSYVSKAVAEIELNDGRKIKYLCTSIESQVHRSCGYLTKVFCWNIAGQSSRASNVRRRLELFCGPGSGARFL